MNFIPEIGHTPRLRGRNVPAVKTAQAEPPDPYAGLALIEPWHPGRRKADGGPAFVRTYTNTTSGRMAGVFADGETVDAAVFAARCAEETAREIADGLRPAPLAGWEAEPGTLYYSESIVGETRRRKAEAVAEAVTHDLRLPFALSLTWFSETDGLGYQRAKLKGRFAEAREPGRVLLGLHDEDEPERLYLAASVMGDDGLLLNIAHEGRHAWQAVAWPEAARRGPAARQRQEQDAHRYSLQFARAYQISSGERVGLIRR